MRRSATLALRGLDLRLFVYEDGYAHRYRRRERFVPFESIARARSTARS
ncbi:MAG: hypothetical protein M5U28_29435 [Sandaracinaceae bacterium]|nr:hypothetical protein [Sandaracinaceae bacterium]